METTRHAAWRAEASGEPCRNLDIAVTWKDAICKSGLPPVWIAAYREGELGCSFCVDGATVRAPGTARRSAAKIDRSVLAALAALGFLPIRG